MALVLTGCFSRTPTNKKKRSSSTTTAQTSTTGGSVTSGGSSGTSGGTSGGSSGGTSSGTSGTSVVPPTPGYDYGTADDPLTVAEGRALLDKENPTKQKMFVAGVVKRNEAWSTQFNNINIWITDPNGTDEFEIFRCGTLPSGFEPAQPGADALVGKTVVATGTGKIYNSTYELDAGCEVLSIKDVAPEFVTITSGSSLVVGGQLELTATVSPAAASQDVTWSIESGSGATLQGNVLTGTAAGSVVIKATATGTTVSTTKTVTITAPSQKLIESITPSPTSLSLTIGDEPAEIGLTILPTDYEETVSWSVKEGEGVVSIDSNHKIVAEKAGTAVVRIEGATSHVGVDVPVSVTSGSSLVDAYDAAMAGSTASATFTGTVVSKLGNSYVLQDAGHGINVYNHAASASSATLGKVMEVTATMKLYNGCPQTNAVSSATAKSDGTVPAAAEISSKAALDALHHNVLSKMSNAEFVSKNGEWATNASKQFVFKAGTDEITIQFDKAGYDAAKAAIANAAVAGEHFNLDGMVTGAYNNVNQLTFTGTSTIEKVTADPTGVTITSGDSVTVGDTLNLTATVQPEGASQSVTWAIKSGSEYASLSGNVLTGTAAGTVVVTATATGTEVSSEKSITVNPLILTSLSFTSDSYDFEGGAVIDLNERVTFSPSAAEKDLAFEIKEDSGVESTISDDVLTVSENDDQFHVIVTDNVSGLSDECTVNVVESIVHVTGVTVSPEQAELDVDDVLELTITVSPNNASDKTYTVVSADPTVVEVTGTNSVTARSGGNTSVTVTTTDGSFQASCAIVVHAPVQQGYKLVTDPSTLAAGDKIVIANEAKDYGMKLYSDGNNCKATSITVSDNLVTTLGEAGEFELESAGTAGKFYIKSGTQYLYAASSSGNQLKAKNSKDSANGVWVFTYANGVMTIVADGSSNRNYMRYNPNNGSPIFSCYASTSSTGTLLEVFRYE